MSKGEVTRQLILEAAAAQASQVGLSGLSIGGLAQTLALSKSGLFAHFRSKEALQVQVLEHATQRFIEHVIKPALKAPRGLARIRAIYESWRRWPKASGLPGGCFFVAATAELDDQPGPAREVLVQTQLDWLDTLSNTWRTAISTGELKADADPEQLAYELYGIMLIDHLSTRLLADPKSEARSRAAFEALIERARA